MQPPEDRDAALARYRDGPALLERAVAGLAPAVLDAPPAAGGWTIRQIVHHVVDGDDIWKTAVRMAFGAAEAEFSLPWYWAAPQDEWARRWGYARRPLEVALALFRANRTFVLELLATAPEAWERAVILRRSDGQCLRLTVGAVVALQADHVVHHADRIAAIRRELGVG